MKNALTLTVIANMTSNYSEGLGNISSVQKVFKNRKIYAARSRESLKNAICVQAGLYDDLKTSLDGAMQKYVSEDVNAATCRALEAVSYTHLLLSPLPRSSRPAPIGSPSSENALCVLP